VRILFIFAINLPRIKVSLAISGKNKNVFEHIYRQEINSSSDEKNELRAL